MGAAFGEGSLKNGSRAASELTAFGPESPPGRERGGKEIAPEDRQPV